VIGELAGAASAIVQGKQMHADEQMPGHWRACGLLCLVLGTLAAGWLLVKYKGRLFR